MSERKYREIRQPVRQVVVRLRCAVCPGMMKQTDGPVAMSAAPRYPHECDRCGYSESISGTFYPHFEWVDAGDIET